MSSPKSRSTAFSAKPPPPLWIGMPSAWAMISPRAVATKQVKSWLWLKIGLRAVRGMIQPIWCEM